MLFFFEAGFFALAIVAIALGELWGRAQALVVWAAITLLSVGAAPLAARHLAQRPPTDQAEARWRRTFADSWRHLNVLLILGLLALGGWWWIGTLNLPR